MLIRFAVCLSLLCVAAASALADTSSSIPVDVQAAIERLEENGARVHRNGQIHVHIQVGGQGQADQVTRQELPSTYTLNVMGVASTPENLNAMRVLPEVDSLYLGPEFQRSTQAWKTLSQFGELKNLYVIDDLTDADLPRIAQFQQLNMLAFRLGKFSPENLWYLEAMNDLESLSLSIDKQLPTNYFQHLPLIPNLNHLEVTYQVDGGNSLEGIENLRTLKVLDLNARNLSAKRIQAIGHLPKLERLNLSKVNFAADDLNVFRQLDQLSQLSLFNCDFPADNVDALSRLQSLNRFDVNRVPLSDSAISHVTKLPRLTYLFLRNTPITDACLKDIATCQTLKSVRLNGTNITEEGAKWLEKERPDLNLIYSPGS